MNNIIDSVFFLDLEKHNENNLNNIMCQLIPNYYNLTKIINIFINKYNDKIIFASECNNDNFEGIMFLCENKLIFCTENYESFHELNINKILIYQNILIISENSRTIYYTFGDKTDKILIYLNKFSPIKNFVILTLSLQNDILQFINLGLELKKKRL